MKSSLNCMLLTIELWSNFLRSKNRVRGWGVSGQEGHELLHQGEQQLEARSHLKSSSLLIPYLV